jgi:cell division cycle protein 37
LQSIINPGGKVKKEELSEEEKEKKMRQFTKENQKIIKEFGMLQKFEDSKRFLMDGKTHLGQQKLKPFLFRSRTQCCGSDP